MAAEPEAWEARKLLHWVNSLPPPVCLLVGELRELRFGDVLLAVACWVGDGDVIAADEKEEHGEAGDARQAALVRLRHVLRFVAAEVRSEDCDALFVVNEVQCAERLWRGDADALCAVLRVLKRVGDERGARERAERERVEDEKRVLASRQVEAALTELRAGSGVASSEAVEASGGHGGVMPRSGNELPGGRVGGAAAAAMSGRARMAKLGHPLNCRQKAAVGLKNPVVLRPKTARSRHCDAESFRERKVPIRRDGRGQLRVYSMIDPLTLKLTDARKPTATASRSDPIGGARSSEAALRVRDWMGSLGIVLAKDRFFPTQSVQSSMHPPESVRAEFEDGVVLCRLAAGIVKKYGSDGDREQLHTYAKASVSMPRGGTLHPQNVAEKRNNVVVAAGILARFCRPGGSLSSPEETCTKLVSFFTARKSSRGGDSVWELLDHVRVGIEDFATPDPTSDSQPRRRGEHSRRGADAASVETKVEHVGDENSNVAANTMSEAVAMPCEKRRSHITSEQMQCVNQWLASIENDILEVRRQVCELSEILVTAALTFTTTLLVCGIIEPRARTARRSASERRVALVCTFHCCSVHLTTSLSSLSLVATRTTALSCYQIDHRFATPKLRRRCSKSGAHHLGNSLRATMLAPHRCVEFVLLGQTKLRQSV